jgi:two-component system chemotaxis response regulator CheY
LAALAEAEVAVIADGDDVIENVEGHNVPLVLFVNPDDHTRDLYGNWLVSLGFDLMCAADAQVAAGIARTCQPDVIVTELQLRRSDGLELIRRLKASAMTRNLPIVVVTKLAQPEIVQAAMAAGAIAVIPLLTDFDRVRAILEAALRRAPVKSSRRRKPFNLGAILRASHGSDWDES